MSPRLFFALLFRFLDSVLCDVLGVALLHFFAVGRFGAQDFLDGVCAEACLCHAARDRALGLHAALRLAVLQRLLQCVPIELGRRLHLMRFTQDACASLFECGNSLVEYACDAVKDTVDCLLRTLTQIIFHLGRCKLDTVVGILDCPARCGIHLGCDDARLRFRFTTEILDGGEELRRCSKAAGKLLG